MSDERREADPLLDPGDAELVRRIAETYRPPEPAASARVVFRARLDERIRRRAVGRRWLAGAAAGATAAAAALVLLRGSPVGWEPVAEPVAEASSTPEEALLALALPADAEEENLPADYQAIDVLLLEGEGV